MKPAAVLFSLAIGPSTASAAEILRCVDADGAVTYQQVACPASSRPERTAIPTQFPEPNHLERDRLFAREAALDRRLEARRERELQEAQMREARAEREAERERLALLAAQASQPHYFVAYPVVAGPWAPGHRRIGGAQGDYRARWMTRNQAIFR